jgi:vacuolar protein-sorting-associated protein 4
MIDKVLLRYIFDFVVLQIIKVITMSSTYRPPNNISSTSTTNNTSSANTTLYQPALTSLSVAITKDEHGKIDEAKDYYITASERALLDMKRDKDGNSKIKMLKRIRGWVTRAEQIKEQLKLKEFELKRTTKGFDSVMGLDHVKQALREAVILPQTQPQLFVGERKPWKGILMYGPPGTGKSKLAEAVAYEVDCIFFAISSSDIMSKGFGDSERNIRATFEKCRALIKERKKQCVLFIDEIDSIGRSRDSLLSSASGSDAATRVLTELLKQMDGVGSANDGLVVVGATNNPQVLDAALRRRFEKRLYVPLPEAPERAMILAKLLGSPTQGDHNLTPRDVARIAEKCVHLSGADLAQLANDILMKPVRKLMKAEYFKITSRGLEACDDGYSYGAIKTKMLDADFDVEKLYVPAATVRDAMEALNMAKPSVSQEQLLALQKFTSEFGSIDMNKIHSSQSTTMTIQEIEQKIMEIWNRNGNGGVVEVATTATSTSITEQQNNDTAGSFIQQMMRVLTS